MNIQFTGDSLHWRGLAAQGAQKNPALSLHISYGTIFEFLRSLPSADRNLFRVVDVWTHPFLLLVALPELVEEHAVLLASGLGLEDGVDAPGLVAGDGSAGHGVTAPDQNPGLVLYVLFALQVELFPDRRMAGRNRERWGRGG